MNRRDAIRALFLTLFASPGVLPIPVLGQTRVRRTVFVTGAPERTLEDWIKSFREGIKDLGYQEGRNITLDFRYGGVSREHTDRLVADAVAGKPDLIITAAALTKTIPIIVIYSGDLVDGGLVESLARPGGKHHGHSTHGARSGGQARRSPQGNRAFYKAISRHRVPQSSRRAPGARCVY
jgi:putative ABC transport system substrate-binding protein